MYVRLLREYAHSTSYWRRCCFVHTCSGFLDVFSAKFVQVSLQDVGDVLKPLIQHPALATYIQALTSMLPMPHIRSLGAARFACHTCSRDCDLAPSVICSIQVRRRTCLTRCCSWRRTQSQR